ncbi:MAG: hypothetical protein GY696_14405 [Gammaproteobacteria bacterium]|nr:hypothetical protein [Gammaproteobacteria bacterium]
MLFLCRLLLIESYHQLAFGMYDWHEMAAIVARKLVENGQERILQRIFDGVTSGLTLDVSDYKESDEHKLLHLVWRKFPRKRSPANGQKTNTSNFIQTSEMTNISSPVLTAVDPNVRLLTTPANSTNPHVISWPAAEKGPLHQSELDYSDDSGSFKGSRPKGQCRKIRYPESRATPLKLSNRFDCLENAECPEHSHSFRTNSGSSDRKPIGSSRRDRHRGSSNTQKSKIKSSISQNLSNSDLSDNGSVERSNNTSEHIVNIGTVTSFNTSDGRGAHGTITMGVYEDIPFRSQIMQAVGSPVTFDLEYISGKPIAINVGYYMDPDELSSGHQSDTYD